jgi:hypothetical protein
LTERQFAHERASTVVGVSIAVDLADLPAAVAEREFGYLLTVGGDERPKAVALVPTLVDGELRFAVGGGTGRNAGERPRVSIVFPPTATDEFSLLVDGDARLEPDPDRHGTGEMLVIVTPTWAVRHRPAP